MGALIFLVIILLPIIYMLCLKKWKLAAILLLADTAWAAISFYIFVQFIGAMFGGTSDLFNSESITNLIASAWFTFSVLVIILNVGMVLMVSYFYEQDT